MFETLYNWLSAHPEALPIALFAVAWIECFALIGVIIPGMWLLLSLCVLSSNLDLALWQGVLAIFLGGFTADAMSFGLGHLFSDSVHRIASKKHFEPEFQRAHNFFEKWGWLAIPVGRFIGPIRPTLPLLAGTLDMQAHKFLLISGLSSVAWSLGLTVPTWVLGYSLDLSELPMDTILIVSTLFVIGFLIVGRWMQKRSDNPSDT